VDPKAPPGGQNTPPEVHTGQFAKKTVPELRAAAPLGPPARYRYSRPSRSASKRARSRSSVRSSVTRSCTGTLRVRYPARPTIWAETGEVIIWKATTRVSFQVI